jgi:hypothetical protein
MIAYNLQFISNLKLIQSIKQWFALGLLSLEQKNDALKTYSVPFYNPNLFVKIGLFIFTWFAISGALGVFSLFFIDTLSHGDSKLFSIITCVVFSIGCTAVLEHYIKVKQLYRSGVDEALLYAALGFVLADICFITFDVERYDNNYQNMVLGILLLFLPFTIAASIRYIDTFTTLVSVGIIYAICFILLLKLGDVAKLIMPFALMLLSVIIYYVAHLNQQRSTFTPWRNNIITSKAIAMIVFYVAGNYFVIRECSIGFFNMQLNQGEDIPLAIVFYAFTALVPIGYIYYGLIKKDKLHLWIGLLLVSVAVLTFKYYFSLGHTELSLTIAGSVLMLMAYMAIRYLKTDKHGITFKEEIDEDNFINTNIEAITVVQGFGTNDAPPKDTFGGGSFGGGGAGADF